MKRTLLVLSLLAAVVRKDWFLQGTSSLACAIAASVVLALAPPDAAGDPPPCDPSPCGGVIPSTCDYGTRPHPTFTVNMCAPDGYSLKTDVYLKDGNQRPVLVLRGDRIRCDSGPPANANYHMVVQDIRPAACGNFLGSADQDDGHALLRKIADRESFPWCDGRIVMQGWTTSGIPVYLAAPDAVAQLHGIQANFATGDLLNYGFFNGGVLHHETADLAFLPPSSYYPSNPPWAGYVGMPIWDKYLITTGDARSVKAAGFLRSGWFDAFSQGTLDAFSRLQKEGDIGWRRRQKVVIGPWLHGDSGRPQPDNGCNGLFRLGELCIPRATNPKAQEYNDKWWDAVFHDNWTPWEQLDPVWVYHMGAPAPNEWRSYSTWPPPAQEYSLHFASGVNPNDPYRLISPTPSPGQVTFTSDPSSPCPTRGGTNNLISLSPDLRPGGTSGPYDQRQIEARSDVRVFTSAASQGGTWIVGRIYADVWIQTTLPDVDVFVRMTDVYPGPLDNRSMLMAQGIQRARYRNGTCPELLVPNLAQKIRVDLGSTALVLPQGHKLRVIVSAAAGPSLDTANPPLYDINPQTVYEYIDPQHPAVAGSITILFGTGHPSALVIPVPTGQTLPPDLRPNTTPCPP